MPHTTCCFQLTGTSRQPGWNTLRARFNRERTVLSPRATAIKSNLLLFISKICLTLASVFSGLVTMDIYGVHATDHEFLRMSNPRYESYSEIPTYLGFTDPPNNNENSDNHDHHDINNDMKSGLVHTDPKYPTMEKLVFSPNKYFCTYMKRSNENLILLCACKGDLCNWQAGEPFIGLAREPTVNVSAMIAFYGTPWFEVELVERKYKCYKCSDTRPDGNCVASGNYDTLDCCNGCNITLQPGGTGIVDRGCFGKPPPDPPSGVGLDCRYIPHPTNPNGTPGYECACLRTDYCNGIPWIPGKWDIPPGPVNGTPWYPHATPFPPVIRPTTAEPTTTTTTTTTTTSPLGSDGC